MDRADDAVSYVRSTVAGIVADGPPGRAGAANQLLFGTTFGAAGSNT